MGKRIGRLMDQNRKSRNRSPYIQSTNIWQRYKDNTAEQILSFQQLVFKQLDIHMQKNMTLDTDLNPSQNLIQNGHRSKDKMQKNKFLEVNIGESLDDIG